MIKFQITWNLLIFQKVIVSIHWFLIYSVFIHYRSRKVKLVPSGFCIVNHITNRSSRQEVFRGLRSGTLLKKRLWRRCFRVNFVIFLRTTFSIEHLWWLLCLKVLFDMIRLYWRYMMHLFVAWYLIDYYVSSFAMSSYPIESLLTIFPHNVQRYRKNRLCRR